MNSAIHEQREFVLHVYTIAMFGKIPNLNKIGLFLETEKNNLTIHPQFGFNSNPTII